MSTPLSGEDLLFFEKEAWSQGANYVCGIDEVGRGPLAGSVVAAAVILPKKFFLQGLTDSKKLTPKKREVLYQQLITYPGLCWNLASVDANEIDSINILQATWKAMIQARAGLSIQPDWTLVDGLRVPPLGKSQTAIVEGDRKSFSIAAASILAKVTRDRWMQELDLKYPGYQFGKHKGYGTKLHLDALQKLGPCPIHRQSFEPVRLAIKPKTHNMI